MHKALLAAIALFCLPIAAEAAAIYRLANQVYNQETIDRGVPLNIVFSVSDDVAHGGSLGIQSTPSGNPGMPHWTGDISGFNYIEVDTSRFTPNYVFGSLQFSVSFDVNYRVTALWLRFFGQNDEAYIQGLNGSISGTFGSDNYSGRCTTAYCGITSASFIQVPEPASMVALCAGLLGLAALRLRF